jgi:hypothetical protein
MPPVVKRSVSRTVNSGLGRDPGHGRVAVVNAFAAAEQKGEGDRIGQVLGICGRELVIHGREGYTTVRTFQERNVAPR